MKKEYILKDNYTKLSIIEGSLSRCLEYVRNYELLFSDDKDEKSLYTDDFDELILNDNNIIDLLQVCEFTILDRKTLKPITIKNISEMIKY